MLSMDVTCDTSVETAIQAVLSEEGRVDVLISNAGTGIAGAIEDTSVEEAKGQLETNFFGTLRVIQSLLPVMRAQGYGRIIALSSVAGVISIPYQAHYSASKIAMEGLIEALRHEIAPFGIKACLVEPGDTKTGFTGSRQLVKAGGKGSVYSEQSGRSVAVMERDEMNGHDPAMVAKVVEKLVRRRNPPVCVVVGVKYKLLVFLKRLVPKTAESFVVSKMYEG